MALTNKQSELWKVAENKLQEIGGPGRLNRDPEIRKQGEIEDSSIFALKVAMGAARGTMPDDETCQHLIDCIKK